MITINVPFAQTTQLLGLAGRTGENEARRIVFDCSSVLAEFPDAKIVCAIQRACDRSAYLKEVTMSGEKAALVLTDADVAAPGEMRLELRAVKDGQTLKSAVYTAEIAPALRGGGSAPGSPEKDMLDRLQSAADAANAAAESVQDVADTVQEKLDKMNAPYTLIETITLEEDVETIIRTQDPDGTPLRLSHLYLKIISPKYTENRTVYVSVGSTDSEYIMQDDRIAYLAYGTVINTNGYATEAFADREHGLWQTTYLPPGDTVSLQYASSSHAQARTGTAKAIRIFAYYNNTNLIPAGTIIEIWGVRDDA